MDLEIHVCRVCKDLQLWPHQSISLFHIRVMAASVGFWCRCTCATCWAKVWWCRRWTTTKWWDTRWSTSVSTLLSFLAPCCLSWLRAVFLGYWLSFLATGCLSWLRAVFLGSWLFCLAPGCLSWLLVFLFLGPFPLFLSFCLFFFLFFSCFVCIVYANYSKVCVCVCVCVCEGGREREIVWMFVCVLAGKLWENLGVICFEME